jgi:hypothetical protein
MKKIIMALLLLASTTAKAQYLDGSWLTDGYGAEGDTVIDEVQAQIEAYATAKALAQDIQSGEKDGNLRTAQEACVATALYTYVKAMYQAEIGRVSAVGGNTAQAIVDYEKALEWAVYAQKVNTHEARTKEKSQEQGAIMEKVCRKALKRLKGA